MRLHPEQGESMGGSPRAELRLIASASSDLPHIINDVRETMKRYDAMNMSQINADSELINNGEYLSRHQSLEETMIAALYFNRNFPWPEEYEEFSLSPIQTGEEFMRAMRVRDECYNHPSSPLGEYFQSPLPGVLFEPSDARSIILLSKDGSSTTKVITDAVPEEPLLSEPEFRKWSILSNKGFAYVPEKGDPFPNRYETLDDLREENRRLGFATAELSKSCVHPEHQRDPGAFSKVLTGLHLVSKILGVGTALTVVQEEDVARLKYTNMGMVPIRRFENYGGVIELPFTALAWDMQNPNQSFSRHIKRALKDTGLDRAIEYTIPRAA